MTNPKQLHNAATLVDRYTARAKEATAERNQLIVEAMRAYRDSPKSAEAMTPAAIASEAGVSVRYVHELAPLEESVLEARARRAQMTFEEQEAIWDAWRAAGEHRPYPDD